MTLYLLMNLDFAGGDGGNPVAPGGGGDEQHRRPRFIHHWTNWILALLR